VHVRRLAYWAAAAWAAAPVSTIGWPVGETTAGMICSVSGAFGCRVSSSTQVAVLQEFSHHRKLPMP
jgi:hypothetical protein